MTRERAIEVLKAWDLNWSDSFTANEFEQAFAMAISALSENKGEWIYDKDINNWRCSKCGQTPPPTGYVGNADFMATHFKFCNHCGADMRGNANE